MASPISKPSRRKEIKEKEQLQARILLALAQNQKNIQSWLPAQEEPQNSDQISSTANASFYDLPILPSGVGLSSLDKSEQNFGKVGDFINSDIKTVKEQTVARSRQADSSAAMAALRNKMRDNSRKEVKKKYQEKRLTPPSGVKGKVVSVGSSRDNSMKAELDSDSDEEAKLLRNRSAKKWVQPMQQKKKGRPF